MSGRLDPREVLEYLNELGYTNITAHQLKDFMMDLKKLMKFDAQKHKEDLENIHPSNYYDRDVFEELYTNGTIASNAKHAQSKKEKTIRVQIKKNRTCQTENTNDSNPEALPKHVTYVHRFRCPSCPPVPQNTVASTNTDPEVCTYTSYPNSMPSTARTFTSKPPKKKSSKTQSKTSFIRPRLNTKPPKSDPVALYHMYKEGWNKMNIPGQNSHSDLRWNIRSKMLGPKFDYCF